MIERQSQCHDAGDVDCPGGWSVLADVHTGNGPHPRTDPGRQLPRHGPQPAHFHRGIRAQPEPLAEANQTALSSAQYANNNLRNAEVIEAMGMLPSISKH